MRLKEEQEVIEMAYDIDMQVTIKGIDLPCYNRSVHDYEIFSSSVPIDSTDLQLYNEEGNVTCKMIKDMPPLMMDSYGRIYRLVKIGHIRGYIERKGEKRVIGYRGRFGDGYMLLFPSWDYHVYSRIGYYIRERKD